MLLRTHSRLFLSRFQLAGIPVVRILAKQLDCTFEGAFLIRYAVVDRLQGLDP